MSPQSYLLNSMHYSLAFLPLTPSARPIHSHQLLLAIWALSGWGMEQLICLIYNCEGWSHLRVLLLHCVCPAQVPHSLFLLGVPSIVQKFNTDQSYQEANHITTKLERRNLLGNKICMENKIGLEIWKSHKSNKLGHTMFSNIFSRWILW
jgi:hypothetical protein